MRLGPITLLLLLTLFSGIGASADVKIPYDGISIRMSNAGRGV